MLILWFFNPITISLSTRGSSDVIVTFLIYITIYLLQQRKFDLSAIFYGITVHFRIYPIIYCMAIYLYLKEKNSFFNKKSLKYGIISGATFVLLTAIFYPIYGYEYLYEGFLYHLTRKDHRHNFSIQFLYIYLSFTDINKIKSIILFLPSIILLATITIKYHKSLIFCMFLLTYIFVTFNKVQTFQYYVWYS